MNLESGFQRFAIGILIAIVLGIIGRTQLVTAGSWIQKGNYFGTPIGVIGSSIFFGFTFGISVGFLGYLLYGTSEGGWFSTSFGFLSGALGGIILGYAGGKIKDFSSEAFAYALYIVFIEAVSFCGFGGTLGLLDKELNTLGLSVLFAVAGGIIASPIIALLRVGITGMLVGVVEVVGTGLLYLYFFRESQQAILGALLFSISYGIFFFRLYLYPFELIWTIVNYYRSKNDPNKAIQLMYSSPAYFDELVWLPLFTLDKHLVLVTIQDQDIGMASITHVSQSFSQSWAVRRALIKLVSLSLVIKEGEDDLTKLSNISSELNWLYHVDVYLPQGLKNVIEHFSSASATVKASLDATSTFNRLTNLNRALTEINDLRKILAISSRSLSVDFSLAAEKWYLIINNEVSIISEKNKLWPEIPNPYIVGNPIHPSSQQIFVGREDIYKIIRDNLEKPFQPSTLVLHGEHRSGKTSILLQLPLRLEIKYIPVIVDVQGLANFRTENTFLFGLARSIYRSSYKARGINLPTPVRIEFDFDPYLAFNIWLDKIEYDLKDQRMILCLDEFEILFENIQKEYYSTNLLGLMRNIIQFREKFVLIFSGVKVNEYLNNEWVSYFINTIPVKIGNLKEKDIRKLITNPIPDFPLNYSLDAINLIIDHTCGQPFLVQLVCSEIIDLQNQNQSTNASIDIVEMALEISLLKADFY
ncbi:MAG: ATP-binding protein, partial [Anaerolineales bacterium]